MIHYDETVDSQISVENFKQSWDWSKEVLSPKSDRWTDKKEKKPWQKFLPLSHHNPNQTDYRISRLGLKQIPLG